MEIDVEYMETECGHACTPNGCMGHTTDVPEQITLNGFNLHLADFEPGAGEWPFGHQDTLPDDEKVMGYDLAKWQATVAELKRIVEADRWRPASELPVSRGTYLVWIPGRGALPIPFDGTNWGCLKGDFSHWKFPFSDVSPGQ